MEKMFRAELPAAIPAAWVVQSPLRSLADYRPDQARNTDQADGEDSQTR